MAHMIIKKGDSKAQAKGTWWLEPWGDGEGQTVQVKPPCGHIGTLWSRRPGSSDSTHHGISADGQVSPSVVCPRDGCDFHQFIILQDWAVLDDAKC